MSKVENFLEYLITADCWHQRLRNLTLNINCHNLFNKTLPHCLGELTLLFFGIYLVYKLRNASSEVHKEKLILSSSVFIELFFSSLTYLIRHLLWEQLSSEEVLILYCIRCQFTVTLILALIFGPKVTIATIRNK